MLHARFAGGRLVAAAVRPGVDTLRKIRPHNFLRVAVFVQGLQGPVATVPLMFVVAVIVVGEGRAK